MRSSRIVPTVVALLVMACPIAAPASLARGRFRVACAETDRETAEDVLHVLESQDVFLRDRLSISSSATITVEIYPSQGAYDAAIMNPALVGTPAISGGSRMQLVSPRARIAQDWIPYQQRLRFASHELVHLFLDELAAELPDWLEEGTATFLGDVEFARWLLSRIVVSGEAIPSITDLRLRFRRTPAADQFSAALVAYLIGRYGDEVFREILAAGALDVIPAWISEDTLNQEWQAWVELNYRNFR